MIYDVLIVGTGAGGAPLARELSKKGLNILILEKGAFYPRGTAVPHIITSKLSLKVENESDIQDNPDFTYDFLEYPPEMMHIEDVGGTTPASLANACYACTGCYANSVTAQFKIHDLDLFEELIEASRDLKVGPLPASRMGPSTRKIVEAGEKLGHFMEPMPKFIDFDKCDGCGLCITGCKKGAKWDSTDFIRELIDSDGSKQCSKELRLKQDSEELKVNDLKDDSSNIQGITAVNGPAKHNMTLITDFNVIKVFHDGEKVEGVEGVDKNGENKTFKARKVVIAAGALNTPKILINSKITENVGENLFTDLFITVGGILKGAKLNQEIPMGVKSEFGPYFLSPHFSGELIPILTDKGFDVKPDDLIGLMVKMADEANGTLHEDGVVEKILTQKDINLLKEGYCKAVQILKEIGVDPQSITSTPIRGAHPGGTAAIGKVVDEKFETCVKGLFVADASVIPQAPGRPPILTITAIAKRLSKIISKDFEGVTKNN
ncbi:GMC family oxidoreductase N-terminal domain-containing protein [Methanobacterium paludis]|uniref:Glucose-methanol-choline oxidoreductase n=1 Tax=Methanobacterium paludis (strain DSM 25820 / JCM 18151 / SWAN1) TaxID=868131 RepID=F6D384_METPW|nr:GMC family oxidoreductase N-terminal domain-containing protein [Methanobacterium paludis]AEG18024.1 glucose-methanol-choline oxidoreductase [Methanobacterium paludis]